MLWGTGNMMCDIMPTISEDPATPPMQEIDEGTDRNIDSREERLIVSMLLEEQDRLQQDLDQTRHQLEDSQMHMREIEQENESLHRRLKMQILSLPEDCQSASEKLAQLWDQLFKKEEEIVELKAERNNIRLLLEHLEFLVSRHEKSLAIVVQRQQQHQETVGVNSEVEIFNLLRSLFEHHKAPEKKASEQLRITVEQVAALEEELCELSKVNFSLQEQLIVAQNRCTEQHPGPHSTSNELVDAGSLAARVVDLQDLLDKSQTELQQTKQRYSEISQRTTTFEDSLSITQQLLKDSQEKNNKLEDEFFEVMERKTELEEQFCVVKAQYLEIQRESSDLRDINDKFKQELANKDTNIRLNEEKVRNLQERLEFVEKQLAQAMKNANSYPKVKAEVKEEVCEFNEAEQNYAYAGERLQRMVVGREEKHAELKNEVQPKEMNTPYYQRLSPSSAVVSHTTTFGSLKPKCELQLPSDDEDSSEGSTRSIKRSEVCLPARKRFALPPFPEWYEIEALQDDLFTEYFPSWELMQQMAEELHYVIPNELMNVKQNLCWHNPICLRDIVVLGDIDIVDSLGAEEKVLLVNRSASDSGPARSNLQKYVYSMDPVSESIICAEKDLFACDNISAKDIHESVKQLEPKIKDSMKSAMRQVRPPRGPLLEKFKCSYQLHA